jgi:hypothetical protein
LFALSIIAGVSASLHATFDDNVTLSGTQANTALDLIAPNVPGAPASSGLVVFTSATPLRQHESIIAETANRLAHVAHVVSATNPFGTSGVSPNGLIANTSLASTFPRGPCPARLSANSTPRSLRREELLATASPRSDRAPHHHRLTASSNRAVVLQNHRCGL